MKRKAIIELVLVLTVLTFAGCGNRNSSDTGSKAVITSEMDSVKATTAPEELVMEIPDEYNLGRINYNADSEFIGYLGPDGKLATDENGEIILNKNGEYETDSRGYLVFDEDGKPVRSETTDNNEEETVVEDKIISVPIDYDFDPVKFSYVDEVDYPGYEDAFERIPIDIGDGKTSDNKYWIKNTRILVDKIDLSGHFEKAVLNAGFSEDELIKILTGDWDYITENFEYSYYKYGSYYLGACAEEVWTNDEIEIHVSLPCATTLGTGYSLIKLVDHSENGEWFYPASYETELDIDTDLRAGTYVLVTSN